MSRHQDGISANAIPTTPAIARLDRKVVNASRSNATTATNIRSKPIVFVPRNDRRHTLLAAGQRR